MRSNSSFDMGNILLLHKVNAAYQFFDVLFNGLGGRARHLKHSAKLFSYNKLSKCVSIHRIIEVYPIEALEQLGFTKMPKERTLYRDLTRVGVQHALILSNYQRMLKQHNLADREQFVDFSSSYFEGKSAALGELGYSRDHEPGKKQITFGVATGMNGIPTALTIQKGNVQDKKHFRFMLKTAKKVLDEQSVLIFDCGANTKKNKWDIRKANFHYLTLKPKKRTVYKSYLSAFKEQPKESFTIGERLYQCLKVKEEDEVQYIFFSEKLRREQVKKREKKLARELEKNDGILSKVKKGKVIARFISREGDIIAKGEIQQRLTEIANPFITGLEGYFILESSVDETPQKILELYKQKDRAEKLIRDMKEGTELRPMRHWSKQAIIGYIVVVFLTNCLLKLAQFLSENTDVKNGKLLRKYLSNLTLTVIYRKNGLRVQILSNISAEIRQILGDSLARWEEKPPDL